MTVKISVLGRKGGVGKTTIAKTLADGCAKQGLSTLLIDADGQGNASTGMKINKHDAFYQLIMEDAEWNDVIMQVPSEHLETDKLFLVSASDAQMRVENYHPSVPGDLTITDRIYQRFAELDGAFDVVVVDTSPSINQVNSALYYATDYALLPVLCEKDPILGLNSTINYLEEAERFGQESNIPAIQILGIIPNMYSRRETVQSTNLGYIRGRYHEYHTFDPIDKKTIWKQASQLAVSIYNVDTNMLERRDQKTAIKQFKPILDRVIQLAHAEVSDEQ